jgi:hypothetical protein
VDEITEEQARSVLIPLPTTAEQKKIVAEIELNAQKAVSAKEEAVKAARVAVAGIAALVPTNAR